MILTQKRRKIVRALQHFVEPIPWECKRETESVNAFVGMNQFKMKNSFDLRAIDVYRVQNGRHLSISCFADMRFLVAVILSISVEKSEDSIEMGKDKEKKPKKRSLFESLPTMLLRSLLWLNYNSSFLQW